jgi:hypothetical protein
MYDIACKFNVNALKRCSTNPFSPLEEHYWRRLTDVGFLLYKVNKFHIRGHKASCGDFYGLAYTPLVGMRAGEEIETGWPHSNREGTATREMDAGKRLDMLQTHMLFMNQSKMKKMGEWSLDCALTGAYYF